MKKMAIVFFALLLFFHFSSGFAQFGKSVKFVGDGGRIELPAPIPTLIPSTFEMRFNWDGTGEPAQLLFYLGNTGSNGLGYYIHNGNLAILAGGVVLQDLSAAISPDTWYQLSVVTIWSEGATLFLTYLDGVVVDGQPISALNIAEAAKLQIGGNDSGGDLFTGLIDEFRMWTSVRNESDILSLVNSELSEPATDALILFPFNDDVLDKSGHDFNGTAIGNVTYIDPFYSLLTPNLTSVDAGPNSLLVSWDLAEPDENITGFRIYDTGAPAYKTTGGPILLDTVNSVRFSKKMKGMTDIRAYHVVVVAVDANGFESDYSNMIEATPLSTYDALGYDWRSNLDLNGPEFSWTDISSTGTNVNTEGDDVVTGVIPIGFDFPYYHDLYSLLRICSNGFISFTSEDAAYSNDSLPNPNLPFNMIAAFWDDLQWSPENTCFYQSFDDSMIIQFHNAIRLDDFGGGGGGGEFAVINGSSPKKIKSVTLKKGTGEGVLNTFQIVLYKNGNFKLKYLSMNSLLTSATGGWQNENGTDGKTIFNEEDFLADSLVVLVKRPENVLFRPKIASVINKYDYATVTVYPFLNATGYEIFAGPSAGSLETCSNVTQISDEVFRVYGLTQNEIIFLGVKATTPDGQTPMSAVKEVVLANAPGNAISFGETNQYLDCQVSSDYKFRTNDTFTIEGWFKPSNSGTTQTLISNKDNNLGTGDIILSILPTGEIYYTDVFTNNTYTNSAQVEFGVWTHIALVFDGVFFKIYFNGTWVNQFELWNVEPTHPVTSNNLYIGAAITIGEGIMTSDEFLGEMDEFRIWNKALTPEEVSFFLHEALPGDTPGLISVYHFDEPNGSSFAINEATNGKNAILNGNTSPQFVSSGAPLNETVPVELSAFSGQISGGKVVLNWSTTTETNNYGWEIQKSEDRSQKSEDSPSTSLRDQKTEWETIGFVAGKGTTTEAQSYSFSSPAAAGSLKFRLKQIDVNGKTTYSQIVSIEGKPTVLALNQNYPNPFNPSTTIGFALPASGKVNMVVFDILGREVATLLNREMESGPHDVVFDAGSFSAGIYFCKLTFDGKVKMMKLTLLK
ncbi:MAG: T9SS type A sorting domain-containing protein [Bacteroidetes bacterium]|nr:T9SS type A sorting domain-containing protein [Bacteroidota bacterium]